MRAFGLIKRTLESWKEDTLYQSRLMVTQLGHYIPGHAKVWILVNGARNETSDFLVVSENMWEAIWQSWTSLDGWKSNFPNIVFTLKSEDASRLIKCHRALNAVHVLVKLASDIIKIREYEGLINVKSASYNILSILPCKPKRERECV